MKEITIEMVSAGLPPQIVGVLGYDSIRGRMVYRWQYDAGWLQANRRLILSADLQNVSGPQYANDRLFAFLQDAMPDRWGRRLIDKREKIVSAQEKRPVRHLDDIDYLTQVDDVTRMGALRLRSENHYLGTEYADSPVPPLANLREFVDMAQDYERQDAQGGKTREEWLFNLYKQGSSLGGARPKASVRDTDGSLWIAKIPSVNDDYDVALWEYFAHQMAVLAGIQVPKMRLLTLPGQTFHTLLSERFDRAGEHRIHYVSAMTLCGLHDGADAGTGNGYLDVVDAIIGNTGFANPQLALEQLYRRVAFSIAIGNHDDHFRNHGFLLTKEGWQWSPAYDINPSNIRTQSILISRDSNESSLRELMETSGDYMLSTDTAQRIIAEIQSAMSQWRKVALRCGISNAEMARFASRFESPFL